MNMKICYGDRTFNADGNGESRGHAMDMHCGRATLRYNSDRHGWAIPGVTGYKAAVFSLDEAVDYIHEMAEIMQ